MRRPFFQGSARLALSSNVTAPAIPSAPLATLIARGVTYCYPGSGRGVVDVDLDIRRGSFTVVTGRIGSGKTTLLRVLLGLLPLTFGEIRWNDGLVEDRSALFRPPRCAYVPQVPRLFSDSVRSNVLLGVPASDAALAAALRTAVLEPDLAALASGLETVVGPRGVRLSGGQVQRVAAARSLVRTPELLVCDDLSSALDVETERTLWQRLRERGETTCLIVSHRRPVLAQADQIVVLKDARVEAHGKLDDLLQRSDELRRIWEAEPRGGQGEEVAAEA